MQQATELSACRSNSEQRDHESTPSAERSLNELPINMKVQARLWLTSCILQLLWCVTIRANLESAVPAGQWKIGQFLVKWAEAGREAPSLQISHAKTGKVAWSSVPGSAFVAAAQSTGGIHQRDGSFQISETHQNRSALQTVERAGRRTEDGAVVFAGNVCCNDGEVFEPTHHTLRCFSPCFWASDVYRQDGKVSLFRRFLPQSWGNACATMLTTTPWQNESQSCSLHLSPLTSKI